jgi:hypothetical protein
MYSPLRNDIPHIKNQIEQCEEGINNGNWEGYSENLIVRKSRLKDLKLHLETLETTKY